MRPAMTPEEWLQDDPKQCEWLRHYLSKKGELLPFQGQTANRSSLINKLHEIRERPEGEHTFKQIKEGWNNHKFRQRRDKKTYSFVLSTESHRKLKGMSGQNPKGWTLEQLILDSEGFRQQLKSEFDQKKQHLEDTYGSPSKKNKAQERKIKELESTIAAHEKLLQDLIHRISTYEIIHASDPTAHEHPTSEQCEKIEDRKQQLYRHYKAELSSTVQAMNEPRSEDKL